MLAEERESVIQISNFAHTVSIWSTQKQIWSRCKKAHWTMVFESKLSSGQVVGQEWVGPEDSLSLAIKNPARQRSKRRPEAALAALAARRAKRA